jgi:ABC-type Fe3+ transport system permease subunit
MFILISREVSMSALLANDNTTVMSVAIINFWQNGYLPELAAFSIIVLVISAVLTVLAQLIGNRRRLT